MTPNEVNRIQIYSSVFNKNLSLIATNKNKRIWRIRLMKLSLFGEDGEGHKLRRIFDHNECGFRSLPCIQLGTK